MEQGFIHFLQSVYEFGVNNDSQTLEKSARMRNVTPVTGELLHFLIRLTGSKRILEIGTSNGYSTLWMAKAVESAKGTVTTLEIDEQKARMARENFENAGLTAFIDFKLTDAGNYLQSQNTDAFDLIFMDSDRVEYTMWWPHIQTVLKLGGLVVVDNVLSHADQIEPFLSAVKETQGFTNMVLPIEQGILLIIKEKTA